MTAQIIWFKLTSPQEETSWIKLSLANVNDVNDLKEAIKNKKPVDLKDHDADRLILKAKKGTESDEQAQELNNRISTLTPRALRQRLRNSCLSSGP
ncbi:hypothetical protein BC938DRAFT_482583 [Jimgerdemannia flammicorona]|uniref:Crinkler effector protein N-terminal domain-containing protein n=1 Tax=Jimgerdemannia flammicorona TaxID=994334 RepID=A0A433QDL0_9FUNG|nr:hypothetical protein BC938DRAFT_482583 [Jimgerdemannia flammicorona]